MRVSTGQIYDSGVFGIQSNTSELYKIQNQMSTGRRVVRPEDDPVAAAQALVVLQSKEVNQQYLGNQDNARSQLNLIDNNLGGVTEQLQQVLERTVQAGNATLSQNERQMIAADLKGMLDSLVGFANTQDGEGRYLYSGFQTQVQPFQLSGNVGPYDLTNTYMSYLGDEGQRKLQVDASQQMGINETGSDVFMRVRDQSGTLTGRSMFDSLQNLINSLNAPIGATSQTEYSQALDDLHASLDTVSRVRASVGSRLQSLDGLTNTSEDRNVQYEGNLSTLQDLDYAKAISDMTRRKMQLEAAQSSFAKISQLSLFNVI